MHRFGDCFVTLVVAVVDNECFYRCEVAFDAIHPGSISRNEDEFDIIRIAPLEDFLLAMRAEVVENDINPLSIGVSSSDCLEESKDFLPAFAFPLVHPEIVLVNVVSREEMTNAQPSVIVCATSNGFLDQGPRRASLGSHFDRPELVEADNYGSFRGFLVERCDAFFLESKSGSVERFQVLVRWKLTFAIFNTWRIAS